MKADQTELMTAFGRRDAASERHSWAQSGSLSPQSSYFRFRVKVRSMTLYLLVPLASVLAVEGKAQVNSTVNTQAS
jgi:hypothetical protein